jgi:hypothetical protein
VWKDTFFLSFAGVFGSKHLLEPSLLVGEYTTPVVGR